MLEELSIRSLGVIDSASLELGPGLNVVTGETGAGKTMIVTALGLLLGARADAGAVRTGAARARVEGRFVLPPDSSVVDLAAEAGSELDEDSLLVSRSVSSEGRSRATAGGAGVPASTLGRLAAELVAVHGQSDQQLLLRASRQRECLDAFAGAEAMLLAAYRATDARLRQVSAELDDIVGAARERAREADLLRYGVAEIEQAGPVDGEDVELQAEEARLGHADALRLAAEQARAALSGDETALDTVDALGLVSAARKSLEAERDHDPQLAALADTLAAASYALADVAADISSYAGSLETDPARLAWVQERRAALTALTRKYGDSVADVLAWSTQAARRLQALEGDDARIDQLRTEQHDLTAERLRLGERLRGVRTAAASELSQRVTAELTGLAMPEAAFSVRLAPLAEPGRDGLDEVTFELAASAGAPLRPLQRGASGGELARVMLAIEVCVAASSPLPTMVFDEVDAGVGGKAAVEVGKRLARLARSAQVIVVTHLPQVAAFADHHYLVVKSSDGSVTTSGVTALGEEARRTELSRMLAGLEDSTAALAHADELVELARAEAATTRP
jgi:DNA repair protein RecN (Recombination protein N)